MRKMVAGLVLAALILATAAPAALAKPTAEEAVTDAIDVGVSCKTGGWVTCGWSIARSTWKYLKSMVDSCGPNCYSEKNIPNPHVSGP